MKVVRHDAPPTVPARALSPRGLMQNKPSAASRDRPCGVGRPLAPGARIKLRTREAGVFHREQVVASGDARAALVHRVRGGVRAEQGSELGSQLHGGFEAAVGAEVVFIDNLDLYL